MLSFSALPQLQFPLTYAVAETPVNVTATRTSSDTAIVSWTTGPEPFPPYNYEVFYQSAAGEDSSLMSGGITNITELTLIGLTLGESYSIFVVAFIDSSSLPSPHSNTATVQAGLS